MSASTGKSGKGSKLGYANDIAGLTTPTYVAQVSAVTPPKVTYSSMDATDMESPGSSEETLPTGWSKCEAASVTITYSDTQAPILYGLGGVVKAWKIELASGKFWAFLGFISEIDTEVPMKDLMKQTIKIQPTGALTPPIA